MKGLRWLFVLLSPIAIVLLTVVVTTVLYNFSNTQCDPIFLVAGKCVEPWHTTVVDILIHGAIFIIVAGIVLVPAAIAPRFKGVVAILGFTLATQTFTAAYIASGWADLLSPLLLTLLTGGICALWVWKNERSNNHV